MNAGGRRCIAGGVIRNLLQVVCKPEAGNPNSWRLSGQAATALKAMTAAASYFGICVEQMVKRTLATTGMSWLPDVRQQFCVKDVSRPLAM
ncbi:hypothetical protein llap_5869 [Limosa lapponica baueri]|uniref:Uncharacterized protein n=1 Tax=Limosa lapponica baueri TaxID=1758121 RepID=A0A2I0UCR3_LIMLA|nr:hypothetical protein llap_5869 [Limosa lapponica baueri]